MELEDAPSTKDKQTVENCWNEIKNDFITPIQFFQ